MVEQDAALGPAAPRGKWARRLDALGIRVTRGQAGTGPLRRATGSRVLGGVVAGLAKRSGYDAGLIRAVLVLLALVTSGLFAACYVIAWLVIPAEDESASIGSRVLADKRGISLALVVGSLLAVGLIMASALHASWLSGLALPILVCVPGLVLIYRNAPEGELSYLRELADPAGKTRGGRRSRRLLRFALSAALLIGGLSTLLAGHEHVRELLPPIIGVILLLAAFALGLGPWWLRVARDLVAERQARIRAEERAEMASRVHDSVLQTLALIQRQASDPHQVTKLARAQERELRSWLFGGRPPGSLDDQATTLAGGIQVIQKDVEAAHGISVEAVTVGDCALDDDLTALLAAAREATVNAAKWSGAPVVSVFAEASAEQVAVYVRDRGCGFDPDAVPADRKGVAESVRARLSRHGGTATIRTAPGEGTEVSLVLPRVAASQPRRS